MSRPSTETRPSDRVPQREKLGLAAGFAAANSPPVVFGILISPIFNITMGLSPAVVSLVLFLQRTWQAMGDPFVGQFSDNFRSKWGRRRPLILAASVPLAVAFGAIWFFPQSLRPAGLLAYLLATSLLFFSINSCYTIPLLALNMEATGDYHERTRLNVFTQGGFFLTLIGAQWVFPFTQLRMFRNTSEGIRWFAVGFGTLMAIGAALPFFLTREPLYNTVHPTARVPLWQGLKATLGNRPFRHVVGVRAISSFSYNIVSVFGLYLNYYLVFGGDIRRASIMQGWNGTIYQVAAIASLGGFRWLAIHRGKRAALMIASAILAVGSLSKLFVFVPGEPWWQAIVYVANGASAAGLGMLGDAMLPDIADFDEVGSKIRREGIYASVLAWFDRMSYAFGTLISGFLLVWIGFDVQRGGAQLAATMRLMKYGYFAFPFAGACAAIWLTRSYPLDEEACYGIKTELEARRRNGRIKPA